MCPIRRRWPNNLPLARSFADLSVQLKQELAARSGQQFLDHGTVDVGETVATALELVGQSFVIDSQQVQHRRVQVVEMDSTGRNVVPEFIGCSMNAASPNASTCHPHGEATWMVVASEVLLDLSLAVTRSAEFAPPNHQRLIEHTGPFQVADQCGSRLIGLAA